MLLGVIMRNELVLGLVFFVTDVADVIFIVDLFIWVFKLVRVIIFHLLKLLRIPLRLLISLFLLPISHLPILSLLLFLFLYFPFIF